MCKAPLGIGLFIAMMASCVGPGGGGSGHPAAQTSALDGFLKTHRGWRQLLEKDCDPEVLHQMRDAFGTDFSPYRQEGDFNRDRRKDFAVILVKETPPTKAVDLAPTHQWRHKLGVLVFNGLPDGQYGAVFAEDVEAPLACFLRLSRNRPGNLYFGVFETCEGFLIIPTKSGYRTEGLPDSE